MMETREPLEWHFKQLDHSMGLSFKTNFNFAIVGHLLKGSSSLLLFCRECCESGLQLEILNIATYVVLGLLKFIVFCRN